MTDNVVLYSYSGTGNSDLLLKKAICVLKNGGKIVRNHEIKKNAKLDIGKNETLGLFFPINSHSTMPFIWKFFMNLPPSDGTPVFFVYSFNSSAAIAKPLYMLLEKKGYKVIGSAEISMANNMVSLKDPDSYCGDRIEKGIVMIEEFAENLLSSKDDRIVKHSGSTFVSFFTRNTIIPWICMRLFFKLNRNEDKCTSCNLCSESCPVSNINLDNDSCFGSKCEFCMRCISSCPSKAILLQGNNDIEVKKTILV